MGRQGLKPSGKSLDEGSIPSFSTNSREIIPIFCVLRERVIVLPWMQEYVGSSPTAQTNYFKGNIMIDKFKKSSSERLLGWVMGAVDILQHRGVNIKIVHRPAANV